LLLGITPQAVLPGGATEPGAVEIVGDRILRPLVDGSRLNPSTVMPAYYGVSGLKRVAAVFASKPVLAAQEIEDLVAYLMTLRAEERRLC
jgi:hypothetical protein